MHLLWWKTWKIKKIGLLLKVNSFKFFILRIMALSYNIDLILYIYIIFTLNILYIIIGMLCRQCGKYHYSITYYNMSL